MWRRWNGGVTGSVSAITVFERVLLREFRLPRQAMLGVSAKIRSPLTRQSRGFHSGDVHEVIVVPSEVVLVKMRMVSP